MTTSPVRSTACDAEPWSATDRRIVWTIAVVCFASYALLGRALHPFMIPGAEWDGYVVRANDLHAGGLGSNESHPYGLPMLLSGLMHFGLDAFVAGRLVSAAAAAALVAATYGLLRCQVGRAVALLGSAIVATNELTFLNAMLASSDMPTTGTVALALWCWVLVARSAVPRMPLAAVGGLFAGIAASFRFPGVFPAAGALVLFAPGPWASRGKLAIGMGTGLLVGLLPQLWASWRATGSFFGNDNWRNLVLKYQHGFDLRASFLQFDQAAAQLAEHWPQWLVVGLGDVGKLFCGGLATTFVPSPSAGLGLGLSVLLTAILVLALVRRDRGMRVLAVAGLASGFVTAMTFVAMGRFLLPQLPVLTVLGLALAQRLLGRSAAIAVGAAGLCVMLWQAPAALERFAREHGRAEMPVVQELARQHGGLCNVQMAVMVDAFAVGAYVTVQPAVPDAAQRSSAELWHHVHQTAATQATDYVVIARDTAPALVQALVAGSPPNGYEVLRADDVLVVRCPPPATTWLRGATVQPEDHGLLLDLEVNEPDAAVLITYFFVRDPGFRWLPVDLRRDTERPGHYVRHLAAAALPAGELLFVPAMLHHRGSFHHGDPILVKAR